MLAEQPHLITRNHVSPHTGAQGGAQGGARGGFRVGIRMRWHNSRTEAGTNEGGNQHALTEAGTDEGGNQHALTEAERASWQALMRAAISMHSPKPSAPRGAPW